MTRTSAAVTIIASTCALAVGAALAVLVVPSPTPSALGLAPEPGEVAVSVRSFADGRTVQVEIDPGNGRVLTGQAAGLVTSVQCSPGQSLVSGTVALSLDGRPILALATTVPMWRDLGAGDTGEDVRALQTELARLGAAVVADGVLGRASIRAVASLRGELADADVDTVRASDLLWTPDPSTVVARCPVAVGEVVDARAPLIELASAGGGARVTALPADLLPGARNLVVGTVSVEVDADGRVLDPATVPDLIAAAPIADDGDTRETVTASGALVLRSPVSVGVIPPTAVYDLRTDSACVVSAGTPVRVRPISSELGETLIAPYADRALPATVDVRPQGPAPCV